MRGSYNKAGGGRKLSHGRTPMRKLALSMVVGAGLVLMAAPASAHYGEYCGYRWSPYWNQWVYRCVSYQRPYYRPYYYPYPSYYHPYYYPYPYYRPYYQPYGPRLHLFFGY